MELINTILSSPLPVLGTLIIAPGVLGTLALCCGKNERSRIAVIWSAVAIVLCGGALLLWQSMGGMFSTGHVLEITGGRFLTEFGFLLELLVLLGISIVAFRIHNKRLIFLSFVQLLLAVWGHFLPGSGVPPVLFRIDNLGRILLAVTCLVGSTILVFSIGYMRAHEKHAPPGARSLGRFYFFFISFLGFMIGLVSSNSFSYFSAFWEATTLCSYALIGQDGGDARRINAVRALFINSIGGVFMLTGIFLLKLMRCGEDFNSMFSVQNTAITLLPAVLLCIAAFTKSALFPFQSWLLGAMVAPTPVSALLHAATMVKAGVYLVMRVTPHYYLHSSFMMMIAFAGAFSFAGAAFLGCSQSNAKKVLAYSTISNLGLVVACAGIDVPLAYAAGLSIISFHALSKGLLFLCVGRIEQQIGSRDIESMDGMPHKMFFTTSMTLIGMMSMLLPPFGMLLSKWLAIEATIRSPFLLVFLVLGSALTVYFWAKWIGRMQLTGYHEHTPHETMPLSMRLSLGALAIIVVVSGFFTMPIFCNVYTEMAERAFPQIPVFLSKMAEQASFPAYLVLGCLVIGVIVSLLLGFFLKKTDIRPPFLCGENAITIEEEQNPELNTEGRRSYDFYSVGGQVEHAVFSSYYFSSFIRERTVTYVFNWIGTLVVLVLIGCAIAAH